MGCVPVHDPGFAVSVSPSTGSPEMVGAAVCCGTASAATAAVAPEVAEAVPALFVAVTATRSVELRSASATVYCAAVAVGMSTQLPPESSQRCHWYENVLVGIPVQPPVEAWTVWPGDGSPKIVGAESCVGAAGAPT